MQNNSSRPDAVARMRGGESAPDLRGEVKFYQRPDHVLLTADISGLPDDLGPGFYGFHIHEGGNCGGEGFSDTKAHYDPWGAYHPYHAGDLPPLMRCRGRAHLSVCTDRFRVRDVIGKTVVIHSGRDDFTSQPAGDSGMKMACGVIRRR